jgi:hypothetical protein
MKTKRTIKTAAQPTYYYLPTPNGKGLRSVTKKVYDQVIAGQLKAAAEMGIKIKKGRKVNTAFDTLIDNTKALEAVAKVDAVTEAEKVVDGKRRGVVTKAKRTGTKLDIAISIYQSTNGDRKQTIEEIMTRCGMSKAGATTYFYNAKKASV